MRNYLGVLIACLAGTTADASTAPLPTMEEEQPLNWRDELKQIDDELKKAKDLKNRYLAAARRAEDEGMRWQFMQNEKQEAKRAFQRAEDKKQAAQMLQARIDTLNARREQILQEHPEANES